MDNKLITRERLVATLRGCAGDSNIPNCNTCAFRGENTSYAKGDCIGAALLAAADAIESEHVELIEVQGQLICDPLTVDKPESIGPEVRRKAREALMEELEAKGLIRYQMLNGVLYAGVQVAAPEKKT